MSSVQYLREFFTERLTAAAEEIFRVFEQTIVEYEEEIDRQRRLLDIVWKPEIQLDRIELPQQRVCKEEEVLTDQQFCNQERNSSLDKEDPEPPQIKEEQEELCTIQEGEQFVLKQETDNVVLSPAHEEMDHSKPKPNRGHQILSHSSPVAESQDLKKHIKIHEGQNQHPCKTRGKGFEKMSKIKRHKKTHTGKKPYSCDTCGKEFRHPSNLIAHIRIHTGEKPYSCDTCGKGFNRRSGLNAHIRVHTGERPYVCKTCGKKFKLSGALRSHMKIHTGEKPYLCNTCGKRFINRPSLLRHESVHTGERPFSCDTCGKKFRRKETLKSHLNIHGDEKPYSCKPCGKRFHRMTHLRNHMRVHTI